MNKYGYLIILNKSIPLQITAAFQRHHNTMNCFKLRKWRTTCQERWQCQIMINKAISERWESVRWDRYPHAIVCLGIDIYIIHVCTFSAFFHNTKIQCKITYHFFDKFLAKLLAMQKYVSKREIISTIYHWHQHWENLNIFLT